MIFQSSRTYLRKSLEDFINSLSKDQVSISETDPGSLMNNAPNHQLYIRCFLYSSISLWCYMNVNNLMRNISMIPLYLKEKEEGYWLLLMKCFDIFVCLLLLRHDKEDEEEEKYE